MLTSIHKQLGLQTTCKIKVYFVYRFLQKYNKMPEEYIPDCLHWRMLRGGVTEELHFLSVHVHVVRTFERKYLLSRPVSL